MVFPHNNLAHCSNLASEVSKHLFSERFLTAWHTSKPKRRKICSGSSNNSVNLNPSPLIFVCDFITIHNQQPFCPYCLPIPLLPHYQKHNITSDSSSDLYKLERSVNVSQTADLSG